MRAIWTIAKKEYELALRSITSYIVYVLFLVITGVFFSTTIFKVALAEMRGLYGFMHLLFIFFVPAITMGSIAKERSSGTLELLSTMPIRLGHIVWGKIFAAVMQVKTLIAFSVVYFVIIAVLGEGIDIGAAIIGFIGLSFAGAAYSAIGVFASSLPSNQVVAFVIAFTISAFFYVLRFIMAIVPLPLVRILQYISFEYRLANFMKGVLDLKDLLFFVAIIFIFAFLAEFNLQSKNMMQER
ncbi:MAG: ABC transporter permease [Candidatus Cloacimonetes bacterium]|nr:ABC transporter permease [Candidatus Cloacimonadota bacterium]HOA29045.1 ABC transporter permease [Candidatus Cloacimonadota bacterium]HOH60351.1 ABC transporter permease [Candidatus Cloacimonadota bacterium]HPI25013.1 ABC transporter permease [Candidatus Cloacimonadota bacterium]